jgi:hypothetical protein
MLLKYPTPSETPEQAELVECVYKTRDLDVLHIEALASVCLRNSLGNSSTVHDMKGCAR